MMDVFSLHIDIGDTDTWENVGHWTTTGKSGWWTFSWLRRQAVQGKGEAIGKS